MNFLQTFDYNYILNNIYLIKDFSQNFPFMSIIISMFTGVLCVILNSKTARNLCLASISVILIMSILNLLYCKKSGEYYIYMMGHFPAPWGNEIRIGILEAIFSLMSALVMLLSLLAGMKYIFNDVESNKQNYYFFMMNLLFCSILSLIYTNDLFTAYVFVEINTLTSGAIIMLRNKKDTLVATVRYIIISLLASGLILLAISMLYDITGHLLMSNVKLEVHQLMQNGKYKLPMEMIICLFAIGLGVKAALFPFHSWLPDAHGTATTSSSAILSGLVLKSYIILFIKICYRVIGIDIILYSYILNLLFIFAILSMCIGSLKAIKEKDIKRMVAYSSIAQIGYIYLGMSIGTNDGFAAACLQIFAHAFTKSMIFCAVGTLIDVSNGNKKIIDMEGAARKNLFAGIVFTVGAFSMIGLPLLAGFNVKYYLIEAALKSEKFIIFTSATLILSATLNPLYYIPTIMVLFKKTEETKKLSLFSKKIDGLFIVSSIIFVGVILFLGLNAQLVIDFIKQGLMLFG